MSKINWNYITSWFSVHNAYLHLVLMLSVGALHYSLGYLCWLPYYFSTNLVFRLYRWFWLCCPFLFFSSRNEIIKLRLIVINISYENNSAYKNNYFIYLLVEMGEIVAMVLCGWCQLDEVVVPLAYNMDFDRLAADCKDCSYCTEHSYCMEYEDMVDMNVADNSLVQIVAPDFDDRNFDYMSDSWRFAVVWLDQKWEILLSHDVLALNYHFPLVWS